MGSQFAGTSQLSAIPPSYSEEAPESFLAEDRQVGRQLLFIDEPPPPYMERMWTSQELEENFPYVQVTETPEQQRVEPKRE